MWYSNQNKKYKRNFSNVVGKFHIYLDDSEIESFLLHSRCMKISHEEVKKVATLARIALTDAQIDVLAPQLSGILDYVEQLNEVNTDNVKPTAQVTGLVNVVRKDEVKNSNGPDALAKPDELLECSPLPIENHQIKVKNVF